ncbi:RdgB/HAM1 family non-canonical purine NTP pyrophosphatase [Marinivivus vitaminiproducens]|uniref:RdgB/HAM1 family non-canonical purine NTP pyrophosphatase n=1 Tax=Marinivivus vitaminiproducens TaxID=3035935 RepID=UPI0027999B81|nr:RdgB/HAM1 family non-canonical purine NTP pyrophosphatase [Geminicoccaceae bacterium SCSIO 64248]
MTRLHRGERVVLATHNAGKLREFDMLLAPLGIEVVSAGSLGLAEPEETGDSFAANAILKAEAAVAATGLPALADDSGVSVAGLGGAPGIYSARWAGPGKDFAIAMRRVRDELAGRFGSFERADRRGAFIACLAIVRPGGERATFEGRCDGTLVWPPRGEGGFGYDPMFVPDGDDRTFGEMTAAEKKAFSHRARALAVLKQACLSAG